jgi:hypothetical protein
MVKVTRKSSVFRCRIVKRPESFLQQIAPLVVYLCIAVVVPVLIARIILRADWRTIRNACILWYGVLVLGFGGPFRADALGWAMIFTMYFSILAIPLIVLGLRLVSFLWARFGGGFRGKPSP